MADVAKPTIVYVVEDDAAVRDSLGLVLRTCGFRVLAFDSAIEFLDALETLEAGCVVTDVEMPGMDGIEMLRRLVGSGREWPAVVVTGRSLPHLVEASAALNAAFVEKPFSIEDITSALSRARGEA